MKIDPAAFMALNIPTGNYISSATFPTRRSYRFGSRFEDVATLVSHKFEGALFPVELANGVASMSSYPSAKVLQLFAGFSGPTELAAEPIVASLISANTGDTPLKKMSLDSTKAPL